MSGPSTIDCEEEDLYSVFLTRSELMGWGAPSSDERPLLWHMEEAEITADADSDRIGFVQVGLGVGHLEPMELPPQPRPGWAALPVRPKSTDPVLALPTSFTARFASGETQTTLSIPGRTFSSEVTQSGDLTASVEEVNGYIGRI